MKNSRVRLCDIQCPAFGFNDQLLSDKKLEKEVFGNRARWNYYDK